MAERSDGGGGGRIRWSDGGWFAVVPEWLFLSTISDKAVRLWCVLARAASANDELVVSPTRRALAERLGCALSTCDAAMKELVTVGAVTVVPKSVDGRKVASDYYLHLAESQPASQTTTSENPVDDIPDAPGMEVEEGTTKSEELAIARSSQADAVPPTPPVTLDGRTNHPLNTLVEECGIDPGNRSRMVYAASALNGRGKEQGIRDLFWLEAVRWCRANDRDDLLAELTANGERFNDGLCVSIRRKAARYRETMDGARLTPSALRSWWLDLELQTASGKQANGMTGDDVARHFNGG